jgi:hypothetical protein
MLDERVNNVIAIADGYGTDALPALAAAQVIATLLEMEKIVLDRVDETTAQQLPRESVIVLTETQLINHLGFLRLHGFGGAVIVLTFSSRTLNALKQDFPILRHGTKSHDSWGFPWELADLLEKIANIKYLRDDNLKPLQQSLQEILNDLDWKYTEVLLPNLDRLLQAKDPTTFELEFDRLERTFRNMLANNSDARHHQIQLRDGNPQNISFHFEAIVQDLRASQACSLERSEDLRYVFTCWRDRIYQTVEGLAGFRSI